MSRLVGLLFWQLENTDELADCFIQAPKSWLSFIYACT